MKESWPSSFVGINAGNVGQLGVPRRQPQSCQPDQRLRRKDVRLAGFSTGRAVAYGGNRFQRQIQDPHHRSDPLFSMIIDQRLAKVIGATLRHRDDAASGHALTSSWHHQETRHAPVMRESGCSRFANVVGGRSTARCVKVTVGDCHVSYICRNTCWAVIESCRESGKVL